jgi:hypothetical protein
VTAAASVAAPAHGAVRAAFYETSYPEAWSNPGARGTGYTATMGAYDQSDPAVLATHLELMEYAKLDAALARWNAIGSASDSRFASLLAQSANTSVKVAVWHRAEESANPTSSAIAADLGHIAARYGAHPSYLALGGRPALFVQTSESEACSVLDRWSAANAGRFHLVFRTFPAHASCTAAPDGWFGYAPQRRDRSKPGHSYTISPGFWAPGATAPSLPVASATEWTDAVARMIASREPLQLVSSWNNWVQGSVVEPGPRWSNPDCTDALACPGRLLNRLSKQIPPKTVTAVGDIACDPNDASFNGGEGTATRCRQKHTAALVDTDYVLALGDLQYENATLSKFMASYHPSWGLFKDVTYPTPGNHEYDTTGAAGYFDYFGARAGSPSTGRYAFDIGEWHVVSLNSNCSEVDCAAQAVWLRADLEANRVRTADTNRCTLAFWHHPHVTDGPDHSDEDGSTAPLWDALVADGAEIVLSGNDHNYQRFAPMLSDKTPHPNGLTQFIAGAGGKFVDPNGPGSKALVRNGTDFGVLKLTLRADGYDWRYVTEKSSVPYDSGSAQCHGPGPPIAQ